MILTREDAELRGVGTITTKLLTIQKQDTLQIVPLTMGSMAIIYTIPDLNNPRPGVFGPPPQLVLSTDVVADIYRGSVTKWNDSRIVADNPSKTIEMHNNINYLDLRLPGENITLVLGRDGSNYNYLIQSILATFVFDWEYEPSTTWPKNITVHCFKYLANVDRQCHM